MADILIVDDEDDIRMLIDGVLEDEGYATREASSSDEALAHIADRVPDLIVQDIWLEGSDMDGIEILQHVKSEYPDVPVIMISGHGTIEMAVSSLRKGAYDFIEKPFKSDRLLTLVTRALETSSLKAENKKLKAAAYQNHQDLTFNGQSQRIKQVQQVIDRIAKTESRILIRGAPGTGKEVAARLVHQNSLRADAPFVVLNCALMTPERMDEELFGTERDGTVLRAGLLEEADGGTLFLDEVGDMPLDTQAKIMGVLTQQRFTRIGGTDLIDVDARIIASTNQDLENKISAGNFREDLYYRLNVVPLDMPKLTDRREDIPELIAYFTDKIAKESGVKPKEFADDAIMFLKGYGWQGNIRQLRNVIEWSLIVNSDDEDGSITVDRLPPEIRGIQTTASQGDAQSYAELMSQPLRVARKMFEREYLQAQIARFDGNVSRTAKFIGMERSALHRKLKHLEQFERDQGLENTAVND